MRLTTVHVEHFKSVRDSGEFKIDEKITCLVGKNESGKTALLQAIAKLNPLRPDDGKFDFDLEYPRDAWDETKKALLERAIHTTWELEDGDRQAIASVVGPAAVGATTPISAEKGYFPGLRWHVAVEEAAVVKWLLERDLHAEIREELEPSKTVAELSAVLTAKAERSQSEDALLQFITNTYPKLEAWRAVEVVLNNRMPKIVYIPEYFRMSGRISFEDLKAKLSSKTESEGQRVFLALLDMVGATIADLESESQFEPLMAKLEAASNKVGREIFQYWTQNRHLRVKVRFDKGLPQDPAPFNTGWIARTRIENTRHGSTVSFDDRSAGFVWFFSFLVWFSQAKKNYGERLVVLLDEPGLSLHAKAQADLLRYMEEKLAPNYQVIYSTHSPFLIDGSHLLRARTVEDVLIEPKEGEAPVPEDQQGTKVGTAVLSTDRDTVFPLQAALGYEITQTLFVGKHTVLVEGPSEILYLTWFSRKLAAANRVGLDPRWVLSPCGGVDKVPAFMSLFGGNKLDIAVLTDLASGQKKKVRDLRE